MKDQINTIRELLNGMALAMPATADKALAALAQLEAMVGKQEPKFWYRPVGDDGLYEGPVHNNSIGGKMLRDEKPGEWAPLFEGAAPVAHQYEAGDMASAAAQGFRDGVASVTQQEPVAWAMPKGDGTFIDVITPAEHAREEGSYTVPLFAHPAAQQPQAEAARTCDYNSGACKRRGCAGGCQAMALCGAAPQQAEAVPSDAMVMAGARMLNQRAADATGINVDDQWNFFAEQFKDDARAVLVAAIAQQKGGV